MRGLIRNCIRIRPRAFQHSQLFSHIQSVTQVHGVAICSRIDHFYDTPSKLARYPSLIRTASGDPPLRASNDHCFIVGVLRAQRITGAALRRSCSESTGPDDLLPSFFVLPSLARAACLVSHCARSTRVFRFSLPLIIREWPRLPFIARIERPQFHRGGSASKKGTWPLPAPPLTALSTATYNSRYGLSCNALIQIARTIHECRREAFETEARRGFSQVRPTQAYRQSVEGPNEKSPAGRENRST
jgi:hypothetical protein